MDIIPLDNFNSCCEYLTYYEILQMLQTSKIMNQNICLFLQMAKKTNADMFAFFREQILKNINTETPILTNCNFIYNNQIDFIRRKSKKYNDLPNGIFYHSKYIFRRPKFSIWSGENYNQYLILYKNNNTISICCYKKKFITSDEDDDVSVFTDVYKIPDELFNRLFDDLLLLRIY